MNFNKLVKKQITFLMTLLFVAGTAFTTVSAQDKTCKDKDKASAYKHKSKHDKASAHKQKSMDDQALNDMQSKNEAYMVDIYEIVDGYPKFNYEYIYNNDGELSEVNITGVDNPGDKKQVATLIYDLRKNKDRMKNYYDTHGIYYAPEQEAEPQKGFSEFREEIQENLNYPERAENYGVEGTVYVKFIVDENGNITNLTADHAIDSPYEGRVEKLKEEALAAVEEVDADWNPAIVDGDHVDSWVVVPVTFDFRKNPSLPVLIR